MKRSYSMKTLLVAVLLVGALAISVSAFGKEELTLRVNDSIGAPGGLAAVVVRTYASRPAGQGQICIITGGLAKAAGGAGAPFAELVDAVVFSSKRDAQSVASIRPLGQGQEIVLEFSSSSGSINRTDGPLGVLYFRLRDDLRPGQTFEISIDPANTILFDPAGNVIPTVPKAGELTVRAASAPYTVEAEGDKIAPGRTAELGIETYEPFAISSGQIGLLYDGSIQGGRAKVKMSRKYGTRRYSVDRTVPGMLLINFRSPKNDLNLVPGELISVFLPTSADVPLGTRSKVEIDPSLSYFVDPAGDLMPLEFEGKTVRFRRDGSESGGDDDDSGGDDSDSDGGSDDSDGDTDGDSADSDGDSGDSDDDDGDTDGSSDDGDSGTDDGDGDGDSGDDSGDDDDADSGDDDADGDDSDDDDADSGGGSDDD